MAPRSEGKRGSSGRERDAERKKRRKHREADDGDSDLVWVEKATEAPAVQHAAPTASDQERPVAVASSSGEAGSSRSPGTAEAPRAATPGQGSTWRMMKIQRTFEAAEEEQRPVEEVAVERYGSLRAWEEALADKAAFDKASMAPSPQRPPVPTDPDSTKPVPAAHFVSSTGPRGVFRRPTSDYAPSPRGTPGPTGAPAQADGSAALGRSLTGSHPGTPIPRASTGITTPSAEVVPSLSRGVTGSQDANKQQAAQLRDQLAKGVAGEVAAKDDEVAKPAVPSVEILPTLDARGRLYDLGSTSGKPESTEKKQRVQTHDPKTGEVLRREGDDESATVMDLVRQERLQGGSRTDKDPDAEMAAHILGDRRFENDLDYIDDNAERLSRKKIKTDAAKRLYALNDYARTKKALDSCQYCGRDDGGPPRASVIASGHRVYLACLPTEGLVDGHCLIVPMQHCLSTLECDDDAWDEIRNFMKCLMKMHADRGRGVVFYETVVSLRQQRHSFIEAVPLPWDIFDDAPAYFRESILAAGSEWSQNRKLVDFSKRPGGFRRSMVPTLPYFAVFWDYKGERGLGHLIEADDAEPGGKDQYGEMGDASVAGGGDYGGGEVNRSFAGEIIGNRLDLEPRKWRRPRRLEGRQREEQLAWFAKHFSPHDWTKQLSA